jgi:hypothetical protein
MKGGARKGAGRKPTGSTKETMTFGLDPSTLALLRDRVPRGRMTRFVEQALLAALNQLPQTESRSRSLETTLAVDASRAS